MSKRRNGKCGQDCISYLDHILALRNADIAFASERDRRYAEVNIEREKAVKIKEVADGKAMQLAKENQNYKDEKANQLREQIESERGIYATKEELESLSNKFNALVRPIEVWVEKQQGRTKGISDGAKILVGSIAAISTALGIIVTIIVLKG